MRMLFLFLGFLLLAANNLPLGAQMADTGQPVSLPGSRTFDLHSKITGRDYRIFVLPPGGYANDTAHYPVVYLADGDISVPLAFSIHRSLRFMQRAENVIIVGVGYPVGELGWRRAEESTPTRNAEFDTTFYPNRKLQSGGAPGLLRVYREEVIPFVERTYRTTSDRSFIGVSLSGLFGAYALFEDPTLFKKWVIGSASLWWDNEWMLKREAEYASSHNDMTAQVRFLVGASMTRDNPDAVLHFAKQLQSRHYPNLKVSEALITGGGDDTGWQDDLFNGLPFVAPPKRPPSP